MAGGQECLGGHRAAGKVIDDHGVECNVGHDAVDANYRNAGGDEWLEMRAAIRHREDDNAGYPLTAHRIEVQTFAFGIFIRVAQERVVAVDGRKALDGLDEFIR